MKSRLTPGLLALASLLPASLAFALSAPSQEAQDAAGAKRERLKDNAADFWIYDDIALGIARAAETGKPLLVSFRCVP